MDIIIKNKLYLAIIIILLIVNILSIGSMWYFNFNQIDNKKNSIEEIKEKKNDSTQPKDPNIDKDDIIEFLVKELKFSKEQTTILKDEFNNYKNQNKLFKDEIRDFHNEINDKVPLDISNNDIDLQFEKIGKKKGDLDKLTYNFFKKIRSICSEEQKNIFDDMIREIYRVINRGLDKKRK